MKRKVKAAPIQGLAVAAATVLELSFGYAAAAVVLSVGSEQTSDSRRERGRRLKGHALIYYRSRGRNNALSKTWPGVLREAGDRGALMCRSEPGRGFRVVDLVG